MVRSTGERFLRRDAQRVLGRLPEHCELINILGSSETGLLAGYPVNRETPTDSEATSEFEARPVPVGWPLPDKAITIGG